VSLPGPEHLAFIPAVLLVGITIGWVLGARAARAQLEKQKRRARE
jgi:hypothetical protein